MNDRTNTKQTLKSQRAKFDVPAPNRTIDFQVDTLKTDKDASAYFDSNTRTLTINYVEGDDNNFNESKSIKAHEQKHRDNHDAGMKNMPMSLEQYYKVCQHNEISANMAELLQLREEYKNAKTEKEREAVVNSLSGWSFSYYFDAVKAGEINPFATNSVDFEKEMKFIATQTQKMWMDTFSQSYDETHTAQTGRYFSEHNYDEIKDNPENYEKARKIAYTIGGIDFTQYMNDIPCINKNIKEADKIVVANMPRDEVDRTISPIGIYVYDDKALVSIEQHAKLSAIQSLSEELKETMEIREQWLTLKTDEEKKALQNKPMKGVAKKWINAANSGKIEPSDPLVPSAEEQQLIGEVVSQVTNGVLKGGTLYSQVYTLKAGKDNIRQAIQNGEADKNYQEELSRLLTVNGVDFSAYVNDPIIANPLLKNADIKLKKGENLEILTDLKDFDPKSDLIIPELKPIEGLSMEQQLQLAQHQLFIENVVARTPNLQEAIKTSEKAKEISYDLKKPLAEQITKIDNPFGEMIFVPQPEDVVPYIYKPDLLEAGYKTELQKQQADKATVVTTNADTHDFTKDLNDHPELKAKWDKAVKQMEQQIAEENKGTLMLPKDNDKAYQKALDDIYTVNGVDLRKINQELGTYAPTKTKTPEIDKVKNSTLTQRAKQKASTAYKATTAWAKDKWNAMTSYFSKKEEKPKLVSLQNPEEYRQKREENKYYTGEPKYATWSPNKRVSPVQQTQICDFTSPYLLEQQQALAQKEAEEKAKQELLQNKKQRATNKFDDKVDKTKQQKAPQNKKQQPTKTSTSQKQQNTK